MLLKLFLLNSNRLNKSNRSLYIFVSVLLGASSLMSVLFTADLALRLELLVSERQLLLGA